MARWPLPSRMRLKAGASRNCILKRAGWTRCFVASLCRTRPQLELQTENSTPTLSITDSAMNAWANIKTITKRELGAYFSSPLAYVFIVIFLLLCGFFTFMVGGFFERGEASLSASFFLWHPWFYLFLVPAVGMRFWAEERRVGTIELLLTMPITTWQAIVGKFLASWLFLGLALILTFPIVITVNYLGSPDNGVILCGFIGSWLMSGAYLAISCITSAMTRNQVVSFIVSVVICLFF